MSKRLSSGSDKRRSNPSPRSSTALTRWLEKSPSSSHRRLSGDSGSDCKTIFSGSKAPKVVDVIQIDSDDDNEDVLVHDNGGIKVEEGEVVHEDNVEVVHGDDDAEEDREISIAENDGEESRDGVANVDHYQLRLPHDLSGHARCDVFKKRSEREWKKEEGRIWEVAKRLMEEKKEEVKEERPSLTHDEIEQMKRIERKIQELGLDSDSEDEMTFPPLEEAEKERRQKILDEQVKDSDSKKSAEPPEEVLARAKKEFRPIEQNYKKYAKDEGMKAWEKQFTFRLPGTFRPGSCREPRPKYGLKKGAVLEKKKLYETEEKEEESAVSSGGESDNEQSCRKKLFPSDYHISLNEDGEVSKIVISKVERHEILPNMIYFQSISRSMPVRSHRRYTCMPYTDDDKADPETENEIKEELDVHGSLLNWDDKFCNQRMAFELLREMIGEEAVDSPYALSSYAAIQYLFPLSFNPYDNPYTMTMWYCDQFTRYGHCLPLPAPSRTFSLMDRWQMFSLLPSGLQMKNVKVHSRVVPLDASSLFNERMEKAVFCRRCGAIQCAAHADLDAVYPTLLKLPEDRYVENSAGPCSFLCHKDFTKRMQYRWYEMGAQSLDEPRVSLEEKEMRERDKKKAEERRKNEEKIRARSVFDALKINEEGQARKRGRSNKANRNAKRQEDNENRCPMRGSSTESSSVESSWTLEGDSMEKSETERDEEEVESKEREYDDDGLPVVPLPRPPLDWKDVVVPAVLFSHKEDRAVFELALAEDMEPHACQLSRNMRAAMRAAGREDEAPPCYKMHAWLTANPRSPKRRQKIDREQKAAPPEPSSEEEGEEDSKHFRVAPCTCDAREKCETNPFCECFKRAQRVASQRKDKATVVCSRYCSCSEECASRWKGCTCPPGRCGSDHCSCYKMGCECDPDLCRSCGADAVSSTPPSEVCRNVQIQRGASCDVAVSPSQLMGWGLVAHQDIAYGDLIVEYTGESISREEGGLRHILYDLKHLSYLFDLNDRAFLDPTFHGNHSRFINHSDNPNCFVKVLVVKGDHRIGLYANDNIEKGTELFFDYQYSEKDREKFLGEDKATYFISEDKLVRMTSTPPEEKME